MASNIDKNHDRDNQRRNPLCDSEISSTVSSLSEVTDVKTEDIKTEEEEQGGLENQDEEEEEKFQINLELVRPEDEESEEEDRESTDEGIDEICEDRSCKVINCQCPDFDIHDNGQSTWCYCKECINYVLNEDEFLESNK
jgi:hypothetical protein